MIRPTVIQYLVMKYIALVDVPTTQFNTPVPHLPYKLKDEMQNFTSATVTIPISSIADNLVYLYSPTLNIQVRLNIWTVDENGVDIERIINNQDLPAWGATQVTGTIHGQKYWQSLSPPQSHLVCGFRSTITINNCSGTVTIQNPVMMLFTNLY